jgi:phage terminase large subunit-like protein
MPRSIGALEEAVLTAKLKVEFNPVLRWNSASAVLDTDATSNKKWEKRKSTGRIDGIVALSMGIGAAAGVQVATASVYETRGIITL